MSCEPPIDACTSKSSTQEMFRPRLVRVPHRPLFRRATHVSIGLNRACRISISRVPVRSGIPISRDALRRNRRPPQQRSAYPTIRGGEATRVSSRQRLVRRRIVVTALSRVAL